jgi:hypothetical protein
MENYNKNRLCELIYKSIYLFVYFRLKKMNHGSEIPLRSASRLVRQLRAADNRHSRNIFLSSICFNDLKDVE